jgi:hypothetical protein
MNAWTEVIALTGKELLNEQLLQKSYNRSPIKKDAYFLHSNLVRVSKA